MIRVCLLLIALVLIAGVILDCGNKAIQMHKAKLAQVEQIG